MIKISLAEAINILKNHQLNGCGRIFTCITVKRSNNEVRLLNCRFDVKCHLKGGKQKYNPEEHDLMVVFDVKKGDYRSINLRDIISLKIDGQEYVIDENTSSQNNIGDGSQI